MLQLQVYPERMAALPPRVFQTLASTLQYGVGTATGDEEVTQVLTRCAVPRCVRPCCATLCPAVRTLRCPVPSDDRFPAGS